MRIVFCGTPEFAVPALRALLANPEFSVEAVVTQPDRPRGRGQRVSASAVKEVAAGAGARIYQPESMKSDAALDFFAQIKPDAVVIIAYGQIIPRRLLGDSAAGLDESARLAAAEIPGRGAHRLGHYQRRKEDRTYDDADRSGNGHGAGPSPARNGNRRRGNGAGTRGAHGRIGRAAGGRIAGSLERGEITPTPQDAAQASYAPILTKEHGRIDWWRPAGEIYNRIRGLTPWPGAFSTFRGQLCHIWGRPSETVAGDAVATVKEPGTLVSGDAAIEVLCGAGTRLRIEAVQIEGRKRVSAREFANGARLESGERFGG